MLEHRELLTAYSNPDFMNSPEARTVRIIAEYLEPLKRFHAEKIQDTVVFFGSARAIPSAQAKKLIKALDRKRRRPGSQENQRLELEWGHAQTALRISQYYDDAVDLARLLTSWS